MKLEFFIPKSVQLIRFTSKDKKLAHVSSVRVKGQRGFFSKHAIAKNLKSSLANLSSKFLNLSRILLTFCYVPLLLVWNQRRVAFFWQIFYLLNSFLYLHCDVVWFKGYNKFSYKHWQDFCASAKGFFYIKWKIVQPAFKFTIVPRILG